MHSQARVTRRFERMELDALVTPGVSVNISWVLRAMSVYTPIVYSDVVLALLETAETVLWINRLSRDDLPAFGAPRKHDL
jgi:alpha-D-ribose 1-methylphosphonate 5-triphosphate synthase subunit PhnH